jgi:aminoglycoside 3-N-acetyltransferase
VQLWTDLNVPRNRPVVCHSFLPSLGKIQPQAVIDTLLDRLGHGGTLVFPAFTYSYFRGEVYDVEKTPSTVGALGNLLLDHEQSVRSLDPNFSFVAVGADARVLMQRDSHESFGSGCTYDKLLDADASVLLLGVDYTALAMFMYLEKVHRVAYRYDKRFDGITRHLSTEFPDYAIHFVRDEKLNPVSYRQRIGGVIDREQACRGVEFGYGLHRLVHAGTIAGVVARELKKDPCVLIENAV